ncbi:MAG TPA: FHA domain-containing protein [Haliangiales bacterium]|nr:FHA domain-containing protein [Haliangiales bacterium]
MNKLLLTGLTRPGTFELEPGFNTLGRNPTNDFRIHDVTVSSFHCEIVVSEGSVAVRDLGSTNGTYIDDQPIQEAQLKPGQVLRLGSAELRLDSHPVTAPAHVAIPELKVEQPPDSAVLPDGSLSCLNHREDRAIVRCVKCQKAFCEECIHVLRLAGGKTRVFCPSCSGPCEPLPGAPAATHAPKKQSLFGRLTQTIRIRFK